MQTEAAISTKLRRTFCQLLAAASGVVALLCFIETRAGAAPAERPNVILILADDLGYECIGANGGTSYKTPVLDKLAADGMRFERCYVQPLCTPTRIQLMTGQYNVRNYTRFGVMNPALKTFGNFFKNAGYATCIVGKWQLGKDRALPPTFGFDEACLWQHTRRPGRYKNPGLEINGVAKDFSKGEYGPDLVNAYACDFITRHKESPFLLYYPMMLTHAPFDPTPDSEDYDQASAAAPRRKRAGAAQRHFAEMVAYMDKLVGKLAAHLDELQIRNRTLILFVGDNGTGKAIRSTIGERVVAGGKGTLTESGMRVPLIANWPGTIPPGRVSADLVDSTDFLPTLCEAAKVKPHADWKIDGQSFLAQLRGEKGTPREWYYSWYAPRGKLVGEFAATARYKLHRSGALYDLAKDAGEKQPIALNALEGEAATVAKLLQRALDQYKDARPAGLPLTPAGTDDETDS